MASYCFEHASGKNPRVLLSHLRPCNHSVWQNIWGLTVTKDVRLISLSRKVKLLKWQIDQISLLIWQIDIPTWHSHLYIFLLLFLFPYIFKFNYYFLSSFLSHFCREFWRGRLGNIQHSCRGQFPKHKVGKKWPICTPFSLPAQIFAVVKLTPEGI